jgi:hypothetical protein
MTAVEITMARSHFRIYYVVGDGTKPDHGVS